MQNWLLITDKFGPFLLHLHILLPSHTGQWSWKPSPEVDTSISGSQP